jgi:hypothetical protein
MLALVLAVWFACRSSTGSRAQGVSNAIANLRCPRNGKRSGEPKGSLRFILDKPLGA